MYLKIFSALTVLSFLVLGCASSSTEESRLEQISTRLPSSPQNCNEDDLVIKSAIAKVNQSALLGGYYLQHSLSKSEMGQCQLSWPNSVDPIGPAPMVGEYRGLVIHFQKNSSEIPPNSLKIDGEKIAAIFAPGFFVRLFTGAWKADFAKDLDNRLQGSGKVGGSTSLHSC